MIKINSAPIKIYNSDLTDPDPDIEMGLGNNFLQKQQQQAEKDRRSMSLLSKIINYLKGI